MDDILYNALEKNWMRSNHKKYHKYFGKWVKNITENQMFYFRKMLVK